MDYLAVGVIGFSLGVLLTVIAGWASREVGEMRRQSKELREKIQELEQEMQNLASPRKRHTHSEVAAIEDATANLIAAQIDAEAMLARHATAYRILLKMREGPHAYKNCEWGEKEE